MRFLHDYNTSKIYVVFICFTLVFRAIAAVLFGYALWVMYRCMNKFSNLNKQKNDRSFYAHLSVMIVYLVGRCCSTYAYALAAWKNDLPQILFLCSNLIAFLAYTVCYSLIIYICWKMFKNYKLMLQNEKRREVAKKDIVDQNFN